MHSGVPGLSVIVENTAEPWITQQTNEPFVPVPKQPLQISPKETAKPLG